MPQPLQSDGGLGVDNPAFVEEIPQFAQRQLDNLDVFALLLEPTTRFQLIR